MKTSLKSIVLITGFMVLSNGLYAAAAAPVDPDAAVYNALNTLVSNVGSMNLTDANNLLIQIKSAGTFLTGTTSTAVTLTNLTDPTKWQNTVNSQITTLNMAAASTAVASAFKTAVANLATSTNLSQDINAIVTNTTYISDTSLAAADITSLYTQIINAANNSISQTAANFPRYMTPLRTMLGNAMVFTPFNAAQITGITAAYNTMTVINKVDSNGIWYITNTPIDLPSLSALLADTNFQAVVKQWRTLKQTPLK